MIAHVIQLAVAPAFLLTGLGALVLTPGRTDGASARTDDSPRSVHEPAPRPLIR
jgi:hypothetical protein